MTKGKIGDFFGGFEELINSFVDELPGDKKKEVKEIMKDITSKGFFNFGPKNKMRIFKSAQKKIEAIKEWVDENGRIWLRKALYVLVTKGLISNTSKGCYDNLSKLLSRIRNEHPDILPYSLFQDKKMVQTGVGIESDIANFDDMFEYAVNFYSQYRDSKTLQKAYVELFTEKDLPEPIERFLIENEIGKNSSKGYAGDVALHYMLGRFLDIKERFKIQPVLLCLSDYDAEGEHLFSKIKERFEPYGIIVEKLALTKEQIIDLGLIANQEYRDKMSKPRTITHHLRKQYVREFFDLNKDLAPDGICQYELEAMETEDLIKIIEMYAYRYIDKSLIDKSKEEFDSEAQEWVKKHYKK